MKASFVLRTTVLAVSVFLYACSGESPEAANVELGDSDLTGNDDFDIEATRFMDSNPGLPRAKANCMVTSMTAGEEISMDDIHSMKLDINGLQEAPKLRDAYYAAMKECT